MLKIFFVVLLSITTAYADELQPKSTACNPSIIGDINCLSMLQLRPTFPKNTRTFKSYVTVCENNKETGKEECSVQLRDVEYHN